jgi:hypothetical protein
MEERERERERERNIIMKKVSLFGKVFEGQVLKLST